MVTVVVWLSVLVGVAMAVGVVVAVLVGIALRQTFPKSNISVSKPAIVVPFGRKGCESLDIIPAVFATKLAGGHYVYDIPNDSGGWMRSSPGAHKAYINALNDSHDSRVKPLILLVKAWKVQWKVPIRSFYLEMRVARYVATVKSIQYARDIENVFESMIGSKGLADLRDPMGIGGVIRPSVTEAYEQQALKQVQRALVRAAEARKSEAAGNRVKACERWDLFFNHGFPSYK